MYLSKEKNEKKLILISMKRYHIKVIIFFMNELVKKKN